MIEGEVQSPSDSESEQRNHRWKDSEKNRFPNPPDDSYPDPSDDEKEDGNRMSGELQDYLNDSRAWNHKQEDARFHGVFEPNGEGRHVLHQLAEDLRSPTFTYGRSLWEETAWFTHSRGAREGLCARTIGPHPR